ncbi:MAG: hypothetical protein IJC41_01450 [Firmicutes bacterium]|nr:hypothetical protein [Bacillota bacterium]
MSEMRIYRKTVITLILMLVLSVSVSGCSDAGKTITSPQKINYFVKNNIEVIPVYEEFENGSGDYIEVSGLKDKTVEKQVNEKLYAAYSKLRDSEELPPYRGIKQKIKEDYSITSHYIYALIGASVNNILSVYFMENVGMESPEGDYYSYSEASTVNLDLNTGEEIELKDVFCDDVDYEAFLNECVEEVSLATGDMEEGYYSGENSVKLTAPFQGINEDQKFYINEYDGSIQLILDHENPEVYCEYDSPVFFKADIGEASALGERYYDEGICLYEDETKVCVMLSRPFDMLQAVTEDKNVKIDGTRDHSGVFVYSTYYKNMPAGAMKYAEEHSNPPSDEIALCAEALNRYDEIYGEDEVSLDSMYRMDCSRFGELTNVETHFYANIQTSAGSMLYRANDDVYACFRGAEYEPLDVEDIFVKGVDVKTLVTDAFMKNYEEFLEAEEYQSLYADKAYMEKFFDEAYELINGFAVLGSSVLFSYDGLEELVGEYFSAEESWKYSSFCEMTGYEYLGVENLTIF